MVQHLDHDKHDTPSRDEYDEHSTILYLIGLVVSGWSELDNSLIFLLSNLAKCDLKSAGVIYYALDAFSTRLSVISGLALHRMKKSKRRDQLLDFLHRLRKLATTRNDIIHAVYSLERSAGKTVVTKSVFRSQRDTLYVKTKAQTGELETHIERLATARQWLAWSGYTHIPRSRLTKKEARERARYLAIIRDLKEAKSSSSGA